MATVSENRGAQHAPEARKPLDAPATRAPAPAFDTATDLKDLIAELTPAAERGDGSAAYDIARALDECGAVADDPSRYRDSATVVSNLSRGIDRVAFRKTLERQMARCASFAPREIDRAVVSNGFDMAEKKGSPAAAARNFAHEIAGVKPGKRTPEEQHDALMDLLKNADGRTLAELSLAMGVLAQGKPEIFGEYSGRATDAYAWELAACRSGMPCAAGSNALANYCLNLHICGQGTVESAMRYGLLSPREFEQVDKESTEILSYLRTLR